MLVEYEKALKADYIDFIQLPQYYSIAVQVYKTELMEGIRQRQNKCFAWSLEGSVRDFIFFKNMTISTLVMYYRHAMNSNIILR